jgi:predicted secreted protein
MRSVTKKSALLAAAFLVFAAGSARATTVDVRVPFPFVVNGQTLPAGQYRVESDSQDPSVVFIRGERGTNASALVMTRTADGHDPSGDTPALTFTPHERELRLADIWESGTRGRQILGS